MTRPQDTQRPAFSLSSLRWKGGLRLLIAGACLMGGLALNSSAHATANKGAGDGEGVLPQGDIKALDGDKVTMPPKAEIARPFDCLETLGTPRGSPAEFINSGRELIWLARMSDRSKAPPMTQGSRGSRAPTPPRTSIPTTGAQRTVLYRLDIARRHATPILALDLDEPLATVQRPGAVTLLSFEPSPKARCYEGPAQLVDVSFARTKDRAVVEHGSYAIVSSPYGRRLFDLDKRAVVDIDPKTSQKRYGRKIPEDERLLAIDPDQDLVVSLLPEKKGQREVVAYQESRHEPLERWTTPTHVRLIEGYYGSLISLRTNILRNELTLTDLGQPLDGEKKTNGVFKIRLPKGYGVSVAQVEIDERMGLAVVVAGTLPAKETWKKAFVFNYRSGRMVASVSAGPKSYIHLTALSHDGDKLFAEVRSIKTDKTMGETTGARLVDLKTGKEESIHMVPLSSLPVPRP